MQRPSAIPPELASLLVGEPVRDRTLRLPLPTGRVVYGNEGDDERPAMWVSDGPATAELWAGLRTAHAKSGFWPLLLDSLGSDARRPWDDGELWPTSMSSPADHQPEALLSTWWTAYTAIDEDDMLPPTERIAVTAPYEQRWPGLAPPLRYRQDPDEHADHCVGELLHTRPRLRLGLVATPCSADALAAAGWQGAANYTNDSAELSAVLRSWEHRFGARVVGAGFSELYLSIAAPPSSHQEAIHIAAEHFAFCPDNVWQSCAPLLVEYARYLIDAPIWAFWWD